MVIAVLLLLVNGESQQAYNVCNERTHTSIRDMAEMVANKIADNKISVKFDIPEDNIYGYAGDTHMALDSTKLHNLGWDSNVSLEEMYRRLIAYYEGNRMIQKSI